MSRDCKEFRGWQKGKTGCVPGSAREFRTLLPALTATDCLCSLNDRRRFRDLNNHDVSAPSTQRRNLHSICQRLVRIIQTAEIHLPAILELRQPSLGIEASLNVRQRVRKGGTSGTERHPSRRPSIAPLPRVKGSARAQELVSASLAAGGQAHYMHTSPHSACLATRAPLMLGNSKLCCAHALTATVPLNVSSFFLTL